jgi:hypothetical protein
MNSSYIDVYGCFSTQVAEVAEQRQSLSEARRCLRIFFSVCLDNADTGEGIGLAETAA